MALLKINDLHASVDGREILKGLNLEVNPGEVHAIMGLNGSGKSTLANLLAGKDCYEVTRGQVTFKGKNLIEMDPEVRAGEGVFLAFQYPVELPGVVGTYFLRTAYNSVREYRGLAPMGVRDFSTYVKERAKILEINEELLKRSVNEGFSGGEKKRNEIVQMAVLDPTLAILDETDSGLDIDALQVVAKGVNALRRKDNAVLVITHYQRLLDYIVPDFVHVLIDGRIVLSGDKNLALELEKNGYSWVREQTKIESVAA